MGQILTKYNQGALGWAEIADATFDPANAFTFFEDFFAEDGSDSRYETNGLGTGTSTFTMQDAHGGALALATASSSTANDQAVVASVNDLVELSGGRRVYLEARIKGDGVYLSTANFVVGLTAAAPATTVFSSAAIAVPANSIMVGRDQGTDSLTGASATAGRNLSLFTRGSSGAQVETPCVLTETLNATDYFRFGILILGQNVQAYLNGKKVGPVIQCSTNAAMGFYAAAQTTNTTSRGITIDYVSLSATR